MQRSEVLAVTCPKLAVVHEQIVVVSEAVAYLNEGVAVVQVVLYFVGIAAVCSLSVGIDVVIDGSSEHILHGLVVHAFVCGGYDTQVPCLVFVYLFVEG